MDWVEGRRLLCSKYCCICLRAVESHALRTSCSSSCTGTRTFHVKHCAGVKRDRPAIDISAHRIGAEAAWDSGIIFQFAYAAGPLDRLGACVLGKA